MLSRSSFFNISKLSYTLVRTTSSSFKFTEPLSKRRKNIPKHRKIPLFEDKTPKLPPKLENRPPQKFNYFVVIDFEATCNSPLNVEPPEIIEFPAVKVNGETLQIESTFHSYIKPVIHPQLSNFCSELTGIIQEMVDNQPTFSTVYKDFLEWIQKEQILEDGKKTALVSCGDADLDHFFPIQCALSNINVPIYMKQWINVKRSFCEMDPYIWPDNLMAMLKLCDLEHKGDLHSGLDDAMNTARILIDLAQRGLVFNFNGAKK